MKGVATKYLSHYLAWNRESYTKLNNQQILLDKTLKWALAA